MSARSVLVLAELADAERSAIEEDCQSCNFEVTWLTSAEMVGAKLISGKFDALVVHLQTPGAARACVEARKALTRVRFPIMALADQVDDSTYNKAFRVGADDVIDLSASAQVSQRLAAIPRPSWKPAGKSRGEALIVDPDRTRAEALGRLLKEAGYLIKSVRDEAAAKLHLLRQSIQLVVVDSSVDNIVDWIKNGNSKEWHPIWVVRARPDQLDEVSRQLNAFSNATAVNTYLGEADVLYEVSRFSQALDTATKPGRLYLYGTKVTFSTAHDAETDSAWSEYGCTYSLGVDDVIVRTLALPPSTVLALELNAPGRETPTRLRAEVTERRVFGPVQGQTAPPGFTARLTGGELEAWRDQILETAQQRFGAAWPQPATAAPAVGAPPSSNPQRRSASGGGAGEATLDRGLFRLGRPDEVTANRNAADASAISKPGGNDPKSSGQRFRDAPSAPVTLPGLQDPPPSSKPTSSKPISSKPSSPRAAGDSGVVVARVKLISASKSSAEGNRVTAPTLKSLERSLDDTPLFEEVAPISSEATDAGPRDDEPPPTTPSRQSEAPAQASSGRAIESSASSDHLDPLPAITAMAPAGPADEAEPPRRGGGAPVAPPPTATRANASVQEAPKRRSPWAGVALLGVVGAIVGAAALASQPGTTPREVPPAVEPAGSTSAAPAVEAERARAEAMATAAPTPTVDGAAEAQAPLPATSAAPVTSAMSGELPESAPSSAPNEAPTSPTDADAPDPSELAGHLGYLYVTSSADTQVFVQGKLAGKTNSYLQVFCGRKYLRLGSEPGHWQSDGVTFKVGCQSISRVAIEPSTKHTAPRP